MSLTLADLRVKGDKATWTGDGLPPSRPATFDDLVEVAESLGGEVEEAYVLEGFIRVDVPSLGRWLVVPIPKKEASE